MVALILLNENKNTVLIINNNSNRFYKLSIKTPGIYSKQWQVSSLIHYTYVQLL